MKTELYLSHLASAFSFLCDVFLMQNKTAYLLNVARLTPLIYLLM